MKIYSRIPLSEQIREKPMRRRRSAVEKTAFCQEKRARAHGNDASSARRAFLDPRDETAQGLQRLKPGVACRWDQHEVRLPCRGDRGTRMKSHGIAEM